MSATPTPTAAEIEPMLRDALDIIERWTCSALLAGDPVENRHADLGACYSDLCRVAVWLKYTVLPALAAPRAPGAACRDALEEILDYRGGADSALEDPYVMERARAALGPTPAPASGPVAEATDAEMAAIGAAVVLAEAYFDYRVAAEQHGAAGPGPLREPWAAVEAAFVAYRAARRPGPRGEGG